MESELTYEQQQTLKHLNIRANTASCSAKAAKHLYATITQASIKTLGRTPMLSFIN